ncbi:hypothetical protein C7293_22090 [filamentous cyanobacterium CCT1]|nr:hypothetical protein C7293_22090 [filamentous cyanobacterium CCT1]PSN78841.1 hypothetical protein C8B47_14790 [filamentous cyanobacterium CCP4]
MQKSSIACRPLADLLGQNVRFQGYLNRWEIARRTGDTACLLQHVKVVPYKECKEDVRSLDHIWLYLNERAQAETKLERLNGYAAVGRVVSYIRSNGTKDYAIDIESYIPMHWRVDLIKSCAEISLENLKIRTILLEKTLKSLEIGELDFGIDLSYEEVYEHFLTDYKFCLKQVEINERYESNKQHRSRPKPDILKFASASSKSAKVACKGFAAS